MKDKKGFSYMEWGLLRQLKMRMSRSFSPDRDWNLLVILTVTVVSGILLYFSGFLNPFYLPKAGAVSSACTVYGFSVTSIALILFLNLAIYSAGFVPRFRYLAVMLWSGIIGLLFIGLGVKAGFFYMGGSFYSNILFLGVFSMLVGTGAWSLSFILKRAFRKIFPGEGAPQVHTFVLVALLLLMFLLLGPYGKLGSRQIFLLAFLPVLLILIIVPSRKISGSLFYALLAAGAISGFVFMQSAGILDRLFSLRFPVAVFDKLFVPSWIILCAWPIMIVAVHVLALLTERAWKNFLEGKKRSSTVIDGVQLDFRDLRLPGDFWEQQFMDDPRPGKGLVLIVGLLVVLFPLLFFSHFHPGTLALYLFMILFMAVKIAPRLSSYKLWAALCIGGALLYILAVSGQAAGLFGFAEKNLGFLVPLGALLGVVTYGVAHLISLPFIRFFPLPQGRVSPISPGVMGLILGGLLLMAYVGRQFSLAFLDNTSLLIYLFFGAIFYLLFFSGYLRVAGLPWLAASSISGVAVIGLLAAWGFRGQLWSPVGSPAASMLVLFAALVVMPWTVHLGMQELEGEPLGKILFRESPHVRLPSPKEPAPIFFNPVPGITAPRIDETGTCMLRMDSFAPSRTGYYYGGQETGVPLPHALLAGLYNLLEAKEPGQDPDELVRWWKDTALLEGKKVFIKVQCGAAWHLHDRLSPGFIYHVLKLVADSKAESITVGINTLPGLSARFNYPAGFADYWRILGDDNRKLKIAFLDESPYQEVTLMDEGAGQKREGFRAFSVPVDLLICDYYINIATCASSTVLGAAPSIANHATMLPSGERGAFAGRPVEKHVDYLKCRPPDLVILEGERRYLPGEGESRRMIMSFDAVTADCLAAACLGYNPAEMSLFSLCGNDGAGCPVYKDLPDEEAPVQVSPLALRLVELLNQRHPAPYSRPSGSLPFHLVADMDDPAARNMLAEFLPYIASLPIKGRIPAGTVLVFGKLLRPLACSRAVLFGREACGSTSMVSAGSMYYIPPRRFGKPAPYEGPDSFFSLVSALIGDETGSGEQGWYRGGKSLLERIARGRRERW
ncbi:MAG: hypothetical protein M1269_04475 [Chloroflexi bacterium]|nr:hypothetical protein [Chloroflexota bacterium]